MNEAEIDALIESILRDNPELAALMDRGAQALTDAGLRTQDLLDELPAARNEVFIEAYGVEFQDELERLRQSLQQPIQAEDWPL